jgi:uncharacterized protein (TIGR04255 family)
MLEACTGVPRIKIMNQFEPIHSAHAIEQMAISVQFTRLADDLAFKNILDKSDSFKETLPGVTPGFGLMPFGGGVAFGGGVQILGNIAGGMQQFPQGITYSRSRPDGTVDTDLVLSRQSVTFRTTGYTSWREVWTSASKYFESLFPLYTGGAPIASVGLSYLDKFYWVGDIAAVEVSNLIRKASPYMAPHVLASRELWHSYTGVFIRADSETKRLLNVNVDCIEDSPRGELRRVVSIGTSLTDMFNQPYYAPKDMTDAEAITVFKEHLAILHSQSKQVLGQIITDAMCQRIALNPL